MAAAHFIYADEMTSLMHGHPLWEPDCHVSIADVGYIRHGRFCRLFNASLPPDDPQNEFGVPEGYEQLNLDERATIERRLPPGPMISRSITKLGADVEFSGSILEAGAGFEFSCAKDRGAVLIINSEARRKDSEQRGAFKKYMLKHYRSWYSFANNEPHSRDISLSDLVFVTGRDNTADWAVASFSERSVSGGISFEAGYPSIAGAKFSIWGSWKGLRTVHSHCGPQIPRPSVEQVTSQDVVVPNVCAADLQAYDQCVFLRGFRVLTRASRVRQKMGLKVPGSSNGLEMLQEPWRTRSSGDVVGTIKERSNSNGSSWGKQSAHLLVDSPVDTLGSSASSVEIVSNEPWARAPVESVLDYILEDPKVSVAVAHDDDLAAMVEKTDDSVDFNLIVSKVAPQVVVDSEGVGAISFDNMPSVPLAREGTQHEDIDLHPTMLKKLDLLQMESEHTKKRLLSHPPSRSTYPTDGHAKVRKRDSLGVAYEEEQERIRTEINVLQVRLTEVKDKLSLTSRTGRGADRQTALRAELDSLRDQQLANKASRDATVAELKRVQEGARTKIKDLQNLAKKLPARTIDELDSLTRTLDRRIEAGNMSLSEEKRVVGQINSLRRSRTAIESYQTLQAAVDTSRAQADELRKRLDSGPKVLSERFDAVRGGLDALQRERDEAFANRDSLYTERDMLQKQLSALHEERRRSTEQFREKRDAYWLKQNEDRAKEAERMRAERSAQEGRKRTEARERLLEKARVPAFAAEIQDCRSLLEYFSSKVDYSPAATVPAAMDNGQPSKERPPPGDNHPGPGWVPLKKKGDDDTFFVGGKCKAKKGPRRGRGASVSSVSSSKVSIPLGIMSTLLSLGIGPPTTTTDVPRAIQDLQKKIELFEVNQTRVTEENVARAEADFQRIGHVTRMQSLPISI